MSEDAQRAARRELIRQILEAGDVPAADVPAGNTRAGNARAGKAPAEAQTSEPTPAPAPAPSGWRRAGAGVLGKGGMAGVMLGQVQNILEEDKVLLDSDEPYPSP